MAVWAVAALFQLIAAPGEAPANLGDVPGLARTAVERRIGAAVLRFDLSLTKPAGQMPGFIACGTAIEPNEGGGSRRERFFVVVPGDFAILDRDGPWLVDTYWQANGCR